MTDPITGTNSEKLDVIAQQLAGLTATLTVWNRIWTIGVPLLAVLLAFLTVQGFTTGGKVDTLGARVDGLASQIHDLRESAAELAALRDRVARLEERMRPTDPPPPGGR